MARYLIIGGSLTAAAAARGIRTIDQTGEVTIVSMENDPPYNRPGLTKGFLRGESKREDEYVEPESWYSENRVVLQLGSRATSIDRQSKTVAVDGGGPVPYDKLLIATGARLRKLNLPGSDLEGVHYIRMYDHSEAVRDAIRRGGRAVVVGGSFIATESAASLAMKGMEVDLLNMDPQLYGPILGPEVAARLEMILTRQGVRVHNGTKVTAFEGDGSVAAVVDAAGKRWDAELVVIGAGVMPNDQMAQQAGLATGNGVIVDETLRTDDPDIFAAGDVARWRSSLYPEGIRVEHWTVANDSGEAAGKSMAGTPESYKGLPFVFSDIGDTTFDYIGYTTSWDRVVMRDLGGEKFDAAYIAGGRMVAAATVGDEDFVNAAGALIEARKDLSGALDKLADPSVKLESLA